MPDRAIDDSARRVRVHQVGRHMEEADCPEVLQFRRHPARDGHHFRALFQQRTGDGQPDSLGCAGNDGHSVQKLQIHDFPSLETGFPSRTTQENVLVLTLFRAGSRTMVLRLRGPGWRDSDTAFWAAPGAGYAKPCAAGSGQTSRIAAETVERSTPHGSAKAAWGSPSRRCTNMTRSWTMKPSHVTCRPHLLPSPPRSLVWEEGIDPLLLVRGRAHDFEVRRIACGAGAGQGRR